jgi:hypothetical protein
VIICQTSGVTNEVGALSAAWTPDRSDYAEALRARNKANHADRKIIVLIALCLLAVAIGAATGADGLMAFGIAGAVSAVVIALVGPGLAVRRLWRHNTYLRARMRVELHPDDGVTLRAGEIVANYPWSTLGRVFETPRVFVVQLAGRGRRLFILLAKRALVHPGEESTARHLLQRAGATSGKRI